ncbi:anti-sigma factor [Pantoea sp. PNT02]|jgi:anti-sigma-K factor RskA|uniref:Anti-sigma factor n=1 Tax=Pantoea sp. BJ2 TaxID=3141322 RepID=A0AAU7U0K8_9GAMM|nr:MULTISPECIES: anti-sigma factor [Pantoea]MBD9643190.1 anti-sigma factor [Pantoea sp. PNT02]
MNDKLQRDDALSAEYALGTLSGLARLRFARRLRNEPALAANVARWQALLAGLDNQLAPVTPPEKVWKKITLSLPEQRVIQPKRHYAGWLAAASVAAFALLASLFLQQPTLTPLTVLNDAQHQQQWVVSADSKLAQLSLTPLHPVTIADNNSLQLWLIPPGKAPISLGLLDNQKATDVALNSTISRSGIIAISLEPRGGSPTGQPTGPVLYSGQL